MPVFEFLYRPAQAGGTMADEGPIIPVEIGMPAALEQWYVANNIAVPAPIAGYALIDTGASASCVHEPILQQLKVAPIDSIPLLTPNSSSRAFVYPTRVSFPALNVQGYAINRVIGSQLNWNTSKGKNVIMLLGRDILSEFLMVYHGRFDQIILSY